MTERELRLRRRIDYLLDQREEDAVTISVLREKLRPPFRHCRWCGSWSWGGVCPMHRDLGRIERELYG